MLWVILIFAFGATVSLVLALAGFSMQQRQQVARRLQDIAGMDDIEDGEEDELKKPFSQRVIRPFFLKVGETLAGMAPKNIKQELERKITHAGNGQKMNFNRLVSLQLLFALIAGLVAVLLASIVEQPGGKGALLAILFGLIGFMFPIMMLNSAVAKRQKEIQRALPDILDFLLVSVEAGLAFDMAIKRVAEQAPGSLSQEFNRALEEVRMGKAREEALRGIVNRTGVQDVSTFVTAVIQAEQLGTNIANTLRVQAATMRNKRRQRAEQAAMGAPIKMLFPLIFFIFPTLFLVILGPTLIRLSEFFAAGLF